jgi:hypothetical protein
MSPAVSTAIVLVCLAVSIVCLIINLALLVYSFREVRKIQQDLDRIYGTLSGRK